MSLNQSRCSYVHVFLQLGLPCSLTAPMTTSDANTYMVKQCSPGYFGPVCSKCLSRGPDGQRWGKTITSKCKPCRCTLCPLALLHTLTPCKQVKICHCFMPVSHAHTNQVEATLLLPLRMSASLSLLVLEHKTASCPRVHNTASHI